MVPAVDQMNMNNYVYIYIYVECNVGVPGSQGTEWNLPSGN